MGHSFERYCKDYENIENYEKALADNFKGWECHHRKEAELSRKELIALGMYCHRPAEFIQKISEVHKGNKYNLGRHWYNNGKENKFCYECPDGFVPGMLK